MPVGIILMLLSVAAKKIKEDELNNNLSAISAQLKEVLDQLQGLRHEFQEGMKEIYQRLGQTMDLIVEVAEIEALSETATAYRLLMEKKVDESNEPSIRGVETLSLLNVRLMQDRNQSLFQGRFALSFVYAALIRLLIMKHVDAKYKDNSAFREAFFGSIPGVVGGYTGLLETIIEFLDDRIQSMHEVTCSEQPPQTILAGNPPTVRVTTVCAHFRNGVAVASFQESITRRGIDVLSSDPRGSARSNANRSLAEGIQTDKQESGVFQLEEVTTEWKDTFKKSFREIIVRDHPPR